MSARFYQERNKVTNFNSDSQNILILLKKERSKRHNLHPPAVKISPIERTCENPFVPVKKSVIIVLEMKDPLISRRKQVKFFSLTFRTLYPSFGFLLYIRNSDRFNRVYNM